MRQLEGPCSGAVILAISLCPPATGIFTKAEGKSHSVALEEGLGEVRVQKGLTACLKL